MVNKEDTEAVSDAIRRLNAILPLKQKQDSLDEVLKRLHIATLESYVINGRSLTRQELSEQVDSIEHVIDIFTNNGMVLFDNSGEPVGAYPFTMEPREHKVSINGHLVYSMCALDALAISPMFKRPVIIDSVCHVSNRSLKINQHGLGLLNTSNADDIYFGINWNAASESCSCAHSLCTEMIFIKGHGQAHAWEEEDDENRQVFTLDAAMDFAAGFFMPLME